MDRESKILGLKIAARSRGQLKNGQYYTFISACQCIWWRDHYKNPKTTSPLNIAAEVTCIRRRVGGACSGPPLLSLEMQVNTLSLYMQVD